MPHTSQVQKKEATDIDVCEAFRVLQSCRNWEKMSILKSENQSSSVMPSDTLSSNNLRLFVRDSHVDPVTSTRLVHSLADPCQD